MDTLQKINDVIDYIEQNITSEIDYSKVAKIACCPKEQFPRLFSYYTGITLSEYIRCRILTLCAFELQESDIKIIDIALKYGYKSHTSFTRAFREYHGILPSEVRNKNAVLNICSKFDFINHKFNTKKSKNIELITINEVTADAGENFYNCFASIVMYIGSKYPVSFATTAYTDASLREGKCASRDINTIYEKTKSLYGLVSGHTAVLFDLSDKTLWSRSDTELIDTVLREFGDYVKYSMDYAGYKYKDFDSKVSKNDLFVKIKDSIDNDMPVLVQFMKNKSWTVITGYNEETQTICSCNSKHSYFNDHVDDLSTDGSDTNFLISSWYDEFDRLYIIEDTTQPSELTIKDAYDRFRELLLFIMSKGWYDKAIYFMNDDNNFINKSSDKLKEICSVISKYVGFPIYYRSMASWCSDTLVDNDHSLLAMRPYLSFISRFCANTHQICWNILRLVGNEYTESSDSYEIRLKDKTIRMVIAESFRTLMANDTMITWTINDYNDYLSNRLYYT